MKSLPLIVLSLIMLTFKSYGQSSYYTDYTPSIPSDRRVDWRNAGIHGDIPIVYNKIINVLDFGAIVNDGNDDRQAIQDAIEAARIYNMSNPGAITAVYLPQGIFTLATGGLILVNNETADYSNICLKGDGSDKSILDFKSSFRGNAIVIKGTTPYPFCDVTGQYYRGDKVLIVNTNGINRDDYIELIDDRPLEWNSQNIGQISRVVSDNNTTLLTIEDELAINYDYNSNYPLLRRIKPIRKVGIEDLQIRRENLPAETSGGYTVYFNYAADCWILGIESNITYSRHVVIEASTSIEVKGSYFHHATHHGSNGNGYGVEIENHSTNCLIEDNLFDGLRHSMMVQTGANRNVFGYNYSWNREYPNPWPNSMFNPGTADISVHGNYPYANLFEGNMVDFIWVDDWHGTVNRIYGFNGPYNTFVRNEISTGNFFVNSADYTNVIGNSNDNYTLSVQADNWSLLTGWGYSSNFLLDIAARMYFSNGNIYTYSHAQYFTMDQWYQMNSLCKDYSYYYDTFSNADLPNFYLQSPTYVGWPCLGTNVEVGYLWPMQFGSIPAYERKLIGGKFTLNGQTLLALKSLTLADGQLPELSSSGGTYKINNNISNSINVPQGTTVSLEAMPPNDCVFYKWSDESLQNPRDYQVNNNANFYAIFKKVRLSNLASNYDNTSQRKFVRSSNGYLHSVCESIGSIWYERSTNNGVSWQIMNNGKPLNSFEAKQPAIDFYHNNQSIAIVFQEKSNGITKIKLAVFFDGFNNPQIEEIDAVNASFETINATPAIAWSGNNNIVVTYKNISTLTSILVKPDLYVFNIFDKINLASGNSFNTSMVATKYNSVTDTFYLAYQELDTKIYYVYFTREESPESLPGDEDWFLVDSFREEISVGSGYSKNYNPVISLRKVSGDPWVYVTWIGWRNYVQEEEGLNKITVNPIGETRLLLRRKSRGGNSTFNVYGNAVNNQSSNKGTTLVSNAESFAIAWSEQSGNSFFNKLVKYSQSNTPTTLSTIGKSLQVNNSADFSNMFANTFQSNQVPYSFSLSPNFNSNNQNKINSLQVYNGREGIVTKDSVSFYFALGDIICNGSLVNFIPIPDTLNIDSLDQVNTYLFSEPFTVNDNSSLFYGVQYGITDSLSALLTLSGNKEIRFKVELLDESNGGIIGVFDDITYNAQNAIQYANIGYQVNLNGIGNRTIRLRLVVESNLESIYSLADRFADESVIAKKNFKQVGFSGNLTIADYNIEQNYPNPFNPNTTIRYQLPKESNVVIKIFDILGNEIYTLVNEEKPTGIYEVSFNASNLSSGVYFYRISAGDFNSTKKMILIK